MSIEDDLRVKLLFAENKIITLQNQLDAAQQRLSGKRKAIRSRTKDHRDYIYKVFKGRCFHCESKVSFQECQIDHLWPRGYGGKNERINLVLSCIPCNHKKGDSLPSLRKICKCIEMHRKYKKIQTIKRLAKFKKSIEK